MGWPARPLCYSRRVKRLRSRLLALLSALPIVLGLLLSAVATPCAAAPVAGDPAMSCDMCVVGILPGAIACAAACQTLPADPSHWVPPRLGETSAWFGLQSHRLLGMEISPDLPPPR